MKIKDENEKDVQKEEIKSAEEIEQDTRALDDLAARVKEYEQLLEEHNYIGYRDCAMFMRDITNICCQADIISGKICKYLVLRVIHANDLPPSKEVLIKALGYAKYIIRVNRELVEIDATYHSMYELLKLHGDAANAVQFARHFCRVRRVGSFFMDEIHIVANEGLRGRLNTEDVNAVKVTIEKVREIISYSSKKSTHVLSYQDIVVLRSCYFEFNDILNFAKKGMTLKKILTEYGIDDPDVEAIQGITSNDSYDFFISYSMMKKEVKGCD